MFVLCLVCPNGKWTKPMKNEGNIHFLFASQFLKVT